MARGSQFPDARFFDTLAASDLDDLASLTGARLSRGHGAHKIARVAPMASAGADAAVFLADRKHAADLAGSGAGACFVAEALAHLVPAGCAVMLTEQPQAAHALAANRLHRPRVHPSASPAIHPDASLEEGVILGYGAVIGPGAEIGRGTTIAAGAVIGPGVAIGRDGYVGPNAVVGFALIGDRVCVHGGAVIGEAGFGAAVGPSGVMDVPQLGRAILQDGVTIGANSCVDRGALADTVIGENTKIDNLVQIAHNVIIGRNCVFAAFSGISGSVVIGDGCMFGGRAGVADHVTIGDGARVAAAAGVFRDVPAGVSVGGYPAKPVRQWMRETTWTTAMAQDRRRKE